MKVIIDTPIWSYALRSKSEKFEKETKCLKNLIADQRAIIIGPVRQELLSGYSDIKDFNRLKDKLQFFENTPVTDDDYPGAAKLSNICRAKGVQGSHTDFLICAVSIRLNASILTTDKDFTFYQEHIPITLHVP